MEKQEIKALLDELGLTIDAVFVPWSASRNAKPSPKLGDYSLNYKITLKRNGIPITLTDYMMGQGHCPSYVQRLGRVTVDEGNALIKECETGKSHKTQFARNYTTGGKPILPDPVDVWYSIVSECDVLQSANFEEWAQNYGYDTDSRKGEAIYRACLETALAVNRALGSANLDRLREAYQDY